MFGFTGTKGTNSKASPPRLNDLTEGELEGLETLVMYLDNECCSMGGLYGGDGGNEGEEQRVVDAVRTGHMKSINLSNLNPHSASNAIVYILSSSAPLIPYEMYRQFLALDPQYDDLYNQISPKSRILLQKLLRHFSRLISMQYSSSTSEFLSGHIGIHLLRPLETEIDPSPHSKQKLTQCQAFERLLNNYSQHSTNTNNGRPPTAPKYDKQNEQQHHHHQQQSDAQHSPETVQDKSIKVTFKRTEPDEEILRAVLKVFTIVNVR